MRIALIIEYDGSKYHGWQTQPGLNTVQGILEEAIAKVADSPVSINCAGRTDTGVHASYQVVHFDTDKIRTIRSWIHGVNAYLPKEICVKWGKEMPEQFHARYSAFERRYRYIIFNSSVRPALMRSYITWQFRNLDITAMNNAAKCLIGENDYTSFRSTECQSKTPNRNVHALSVIRKDELVIIDIKANAFLHHMVRNIAGVLMAVGSGKKPVSWVEEVLNAKNRTLGAETAPASGLYLVGVKYPKEFGIMALTAGPFFLTI